LSNVSGPVSCWDKFRLKDQAMFDGSIFNVDPHELQVTWRRVYNDDVWLYESYLWIESVVEGSDLYKYILVGQQYIK